MLCGTYELERGVQVGTCTNRWYEKLQIIVAANGTAGINFEHSGVDGHTWANLLLLHAKKWDRLTFLSQCPSIRGRYLYGTHPPLRKEHQ